MALIDINIDFLNFLMNPSYRYIENKIVYFKEEYIEEYGEQYRDIIENNFKRVNYVFGESVFNLENFINQFQKELILEIDREIISIFQNDKSLTFRSFLNFLEKELKNVPVRTLEEDSNLDIVRICIKKYFIELKKNTEKEEIRILCEKQLNKIEQYIDKFDQIKKILQPKMAKIEEIKQKKLQDRVNLQRTFIKTNFYLLPQEVRKFIIQNKEFSIQELFNRFSYMKLYLEEKNLDSIFQLGDIQWFQKKYDNDSSVLSVRKNILKKQGIEIDNINLSDGDSCLKALKFTYQTVDQIYYGSVALDMYESSLAAYNRLLKIKREKYRYLSSKQELIKDSLMSERILNRKCNQEIKNVFLSLENISISEECIKIGELLYDRIMESEFSAFFYSDILKFFSQDKETVVELNYVVIRNILEPSFQCGALISDIYFTLCHELGHVSTKGKNGIIGINIEKKYKLLNELWNEYFSNKVMEKLLNLYPHLWEQSIKNENLSLYQLNFFLIEPFIFKYESYFKTAMIENDLFLLINLFGEDLLEEYVALINDFFFYQKTQYNHDCEAIFQEEPEYINQLKIRIKEIVNIISKQNKEYTLKKINQ